MERGGERERDGAIVCDSLKDREGVATFLQNAASTTNTKLLYFANEQLRFIQIYISIC